MAKINLDYEHLKNTFFFKDKTDLQQYSLSTKVIKWALIKQLHPSSLEKCSEPVTSLSDCAIIFVEKLTVIKYKTTIIRELFFRFVPVEKFWNNKNDHNEKYFI